MQRQLAMQVQRLEAQREAQRALQAEQAALQDEQEAQREAQRAQQAKQAAVQDEQLAHQIQSLHSEQATLLERLQKELLQQQVL